MGAGNLAHGLVAAAGEIGLDHFGMRWLGCSGVEGGEGIVQAPHHDEGRDDGEGALKLVKAEGGEPFAKS